MDKITLDDQLCAKLNGLTTSVLACDESGQIIGHFLSDGFYKKLMYAWLKSQHTDEELEEDRQQTGGRPLAEIWRDLGAK
jgi:hypothetical protein